MSKGPGRIQRAFKELFEAEPDNAFTTTELCERVYDVEETDKSHRIAVIRAAKKIPGLDYWVSENLGNQLVFYDSLNVLSYAMARLKADFLENYRNADPRCPPHWKNDTEADLRAKLGKATVRFYVGWTDHFQVPNGRHFPPLNAMDCRI